MAAIWTKLNKTYGSLLVFHRKNKEIRGNIGKLLCLYPISIFIR
jgi:hypothetical protein